MEIINTHRVFDLHNLVPKFEMMLKIEFSPETEVLSDEKIQGAKQGLEFYENLVKNLKLENSLKYFPVIRELLEKPITRGKFSCELEILNVRIEHELEDLAFGFIPKEKTEYFEKKRLFGDDVFEHFQSARDEIKEAGNCFAMNLNTACVFHLMRVIEIGARAMYWQMARRKNVIYEKYKKSRGKKVSANKPMELCDWNTLIKGFNVALENLDIRKGKSIAKHQTHAYFNRLVKIFDNFRSGWRNVISHGNEIDRASKRTLFKEGETLDLMRDTERFMRLLAERVKEKQYEKES